MDERQMSVDIIIGEADDYRGRWVAHLYKARDMDAVDESILSTLTGYGDTPLKAAAALLTLAASERERREE